MIACLRGEVRPEMVEALHRIRGPFRPALADQQLPHRYCRLVERGQLRRLVDLFDVVVESSRVGVRKPEVRFYEIALEQLGIEASEAVFLDDLGINLKPARAARHGHDQGGRPGRGLSELSELLRDALS